ncbi:MAG TPA: S41 family peptidase [Ignavibacteria bacterium]|nr:S41 family peptidase [Ignavibacteria bacterium]
MNKVKNSFIKHKFIMIATIISLMLPVTGAAVKCQSNEVAGKSLSSAEKESAVNSISKLMFDNYIFPAVSVEMGEYLNSRLKNGEYNGFSDPQLFADEITNDLQFISKDKHIRVQYNPEQIKKMNSLPKEDENIVSQEFIQMLKNENFGFKKVERLGGNIGYIDFRNFGPGDLIKEKVEDVMGFVENCNALIFDMRYNGGGDPTGIQVITSYLFGEDPVHLNDLYYRPNDTTEQYWTLKDIKGKRMPDVPVYILTSSFTFSGAEEFTYNLKNLKRATVIGETTGGGAHPGGMNIADENFIVFVPIGRAINPITKTNWEGTGVTPDIEINSISALTKAHILALEKIVSLSGTNDNKLNWLIESLTAALNEINIDNSILNEYAGVYGDRKIFLEEGKLYYQRNNRQKFEMTPMSEDTFMFSDIDYFRVKFVKDDSGKVTELIGMYVDGKTDRSEKINDQ